MDPLAQLTAALADRYLVDREIGRGGMATVFLARDVRHNRRVALKVLSPELGAVLGVERFLSEIQVTANLQHPNLLPLFDSGEADGLLFYVMPYVEGESLRATLLREKQLPIDDAVHIASAIASALDYAHRHGVIHRDLKPENILMQDGQPLVADFGIALAVSNAGGNRITQTGLSLGTPHYMSPEQATGDREIDGRTDVYSLGALTYEMLVGEPPHDGKTSQAIIAKVLTDKPRAIRLSRPSVPPHVEAAVDRALEKLPADRQHTAQEFAVELSGKAIARLGAQGAGATTVLGAASVDRRRARVRATIPWIITAAALVTAGAAWRSSARREPDAGVLRYEIPLPPGMALRVGAGGAGQPIAIARGGRFVAYAARAIDGRQRLYVRAADDLQPREVPNSEDATFPAFSPDGAWLAFFAGGQLLKWPTSGGETVLLADVQALRGMTWTPKGDIVISNLGRLAKIPSAGGTLASFSRPDTLKGEAGQFTPVALPDGESLLYTSLGMGGQATARIGIASLADGSSTILDLRGSFPLGMLDGSLLYTSAAGTIMAAPFDARARRVTGAPVPLGDQVAIDVLNSLSYAQLSPDGSLAYVSGTQQRQLVLAESGGAARILPQVEGSSWPRLSPDGKRIALSLGTPTRRDVWLYELPAGPMTRLTTGGTINDRPEWTSDGASVLFRSNRRSPNALWVQAAYDGTAARPLFGEAGVQIDEGVLSGDGRYLVVQRDRDGNGEVWYRAMQGDTTLRRVDGGFGARLSPDGKWLAYASGGAATIQVYVRPFLTSGERYQVSLNGGTTPVWSADGRRIYYTASGQLLVATIGSLQPFRIASRAIVLPGGFNFDGVHADYDVTRDGRTIVAHQSAAQDARLVVVRNYADEVRAHVGRAATSGRE